MTMSPGLRKSWRGPGSVPATAATKLGPSEPVKDPGEKAQWGCGGLGLGLTLTYMNLSDSSVFQRISHLAFQLDLVGPKSYSLGSVHVAHCLMPGSDAAETQL